MSRNFSVTELKALADQLVTTMRSAGAIIMDIYKTDFHVASKTDDSPVTRADQEAEVVILAALRELTPGIPIVAEEAVAAGEVPVVEEKFWLVDPLDGTKEFISKNGEFTVNIALIQNAQPLMGLVYAPAIDQLYVGIVGLGAYRHSAAGIQQLTTRQVPFEGLTVIASRSHGDADALDKFLAGKKVAQLKSAGSSLKICLVAAGEADIYPRLGRTMEWDIAAGHAVLLAAGGLITETDGSAFHYGKPDFANPHFVAWGAGAPVVE